MLHRSTTTASTDIKTPSDPVMKQGSVDQLREELAALQRERAVLQRDLAHTEQVCTASGRASSL